jgi:uncharacterized protein YbjT (DUF2867 family)
MVGATGSIGRLAVTAAQRHGLRPRALVRDMSRAEPISVQRSRAEEQRTACLYGPAHGLGRLPPTGKRILPACFS